MRSIHRYIINTIAVQKPGSFIFPSHFKALGADTAIGMALRRLTASGQLKKLAHGIFIKPGKDVTLLEIAEAIASRDHCKIRPSGALARYKLGLLNKCPVDLEFSTDGAPRKIKVNNCYIIFRACIARKMMLKGKVSSLVIEVLEDMGQDTMTIDIVTKMRRLLEREDRFALQHDMLAPAWIVKMFHPAAMKKEKIQ
ncbi:MAG TPA: DUF6088 family protein [Chitinophagaceae bacterium]|jgi:hypothetical protein|nr:DUF6088 family protein [Chitinophagaceae bacterium]